MKQVNVSELTGAALDWAVAKCEVGADFIGEIDDPHFYSTDWAQGGPIIEREIDAIYRTRLSTAEVTYEAMAIGDSECTGYGPTPLIAAMRCYVASKLGDTVEVPEELA